MPQYIVTILCKHNTTMSWACNLDRKSKPSLRYLEVNPLEGQLFGSSSLWEERVKVYFTSTIIELYQK
jgi:hypothetical protein